jgi:RHS repeat-associated protein
LPGERQYQYTPAAGSGVTYDVMSGSVSTANADGGASAYQSSGGGTEHRDVATTGGSDGGNFSHMLSQVTSPMGEVTKFERGTNGRINKVTYPDGGTRTLAYDAANRPQTITLPQGTVVNLSHDSLGRETSRTTSTGEFRTLTYGVGDRIETMTDNTGTTDYEYDSAGRFSGIVYPHGGSVRYLRDKLDRTTDVKVKPSAAGAEIVTHYEYDENGNLAEVTDPNGGITGFLYDDADRLEQRVLPNGVVTSYGYDSRDRVLSVVHKNASNVVLASVTYIRSASGEPTRITREDGTYTDVEYDTALRVKKESEHDANDVLVAETTYGYDNDGNRTSKTTLTGSETYSYAAGFKLTGITSSAGNETYGHDAGGRLTSITRDGSTKTLSYDSMDHITHVAGGGVDETYEFDGMGRRVGVTTLGGGSKRFLTAPNLGDGYESPQAVVDDLGNLVATFVYAGEHPIAKITPSGVEYFLADSMGSVIGKANAAGASTASIKYGAFGDVIGGSNTGIDAAVGFEHRFQGMALDGESGIYFVRSRSYDSRAARFVSRDPVAGYRHVAETLNPYVFAANNPETYRDPSGESLMEVMSVGIAMTNIAMSGEGTSWAGFFKRDADVTVTSRTIGKNSLEDEAWKKFGHASVVIDLGTAEAPQHWIAQGGEQQGHVYGEAHQVSSQGWYKELSSSSDLIWNEAELPKEQRTVSTVPVYIAAKMRIHSQVPLTGPFLQMIAGQANRELAAFSYEFHGDPPTPSGPNSNTWAASYLRALGVSTDFTPAGPLPLPGWDWRP